MNQRLTGAVVLALAAAAGTTTGAVIHQTNIATPLSAPTRTSTTPPTTGQTTPTTPVGHPSTSQSPPPTSTSLKTTPPPTATGPKPLGNLSIKSLLATSDYAAVGVRNLRNFHAVGAPPQYWPFACAVESVFPHSPANITYFGDARSDYGSDATQVAQFLFDAPSETEARSQLDAVKGMHRRCESATRTPLGKVQRPPIRGIDLPDVSQSGWWQMTYSVDGRSKAELVGYARIGARLTVFVVTVPRDQLAAVDMDQLVRSAATKMR